MIDFKTAAEWERVARSYARAVGLDENSVFVADVCEQGFDQGAIAHSHVQIPGKICLNPAVFYLPSRNAIGRLTTIIHELGHLVLPADGHGPKWKEWTYAWGSAYRMRYGTSTLNVNLHQLHAATAKSYFPACAQMYYPIDDWCDECKAKRDEQIEINKKISAAKVYRSGITCGRGNHDYRIVNCGTYFKCAKCASTKSIRGMTRSA